MPLIQNPSIARKLQRFLRLTHLPDSVLAPETVPVIVVEDLSPPLADIERGCNGGESVTGIVAERAFVALVRVGAPAEYDLILNRIVVAGGVTGEYQLIIPTVELTGLAVSADTSFDDLGIPGRPSSQVGGNSVAVLPTGRAVLRWTMLGNTMQQFDLNMRIGTIGNPGNLTSVYVSGPQFSNLRAFFQWTEAQPLG